MPAAIISPAQCSEHAVPDGHPERPARVAAINDFIIASGLELGLQFIEAPEARDREILRAHSKEHLKRIKEATPKSVSESIEIDGDTYLSHASLSAAKLSAGAAVRAVDAVIKENYSSVFCNVRPPGHHAERDKAMGFCIFNNVAIAALHALEKHALKRVAIVDFDVHHGNGTQDIFLDDKRVLFCSSFQYPFYPNTDIAPDREHIINVPLQAGCGSDEFRNKLSGAWFNRLENFKPELILISAGFDAHQCDDIAALNLKDDDYYWISKALRNIADSIEGCRGIVSVLEGGYELRSLARSTVEHIKGITHL